MTRWHTRKETLSTEYQRDDVQQYLQDISQFSPITAGEERDLARRILQGDQEAQGEHYNLEILGNIV